MNIASLLRKKWLLAAVAAAVVGSAAYAFAATLGVSSASLGAGNTTVSSCANSVSATYTNAYDTAASGTGGKFAVKTVSLAFDAGTTCTENDTIEVVVNGTSNTPLAGFVYTVGAGDTLAGKSIQVTAGGTTVTGDGWVDGTVGSPSAGTDGSDFTDAADAVTATTAIPAESVTGIAVSAVGAAA